MANVSDLIVEYRLREWARWKFEADDIGIGFPSVSIMQRALEMKSKNGYMSKGYEMRLNQSAEGIDKYLSDLKSYNPGWYDAIVKRYYKLATLTTRRLAKEMGIAHSTLMEFLKGAKIFIAGRISTENFDPYKK